MLPIVGELVIEQKSEGRKSRFRGKKTPSETWSHRRNVWPLPEEGFELRFIVNDLQSEEHTEYRGAFGDLRIPQPDWVWVLDNEPVVTDDFEFTVQAAMETDLLDMHVFDEMVWVRAPEPVYQILETETEVLVGVPATVDLERPVFNALNEAAALVEARRIARKREVIQLARIDVIDPAAVCVRGRTRNNGSRHPVAELVEVRVAEIATALSTLQESLENLELPASDIVAQLSVLATASRRLLDDARTLNNDPNAR